MPVRPLTPEALRVEIAEAIVAGGATRVLVDGAPPARPDLLADGLVDLLRLGNVFQDLLNDVPVVVADVAVNESFLRLACLLG